MTYPPKKPIEATEEVDLFLVLRLIFINGWIFLAAVAGGGLVGWTMAKFIMTPQYRSTAVIMPGNENSNVSGSLRNVLSSSPLGALIGASGASENTAKYVEVLESRALASKIVDGEGLVQNTDGLAPDEIAKRREAMIEGIRSRTKVEPLTSGIIKIEFRSPSAPYSQRIVDLHLQSLQHMVGSTLQTQAKATEVFVKERLEESQKKLAEVEARYIRLQKDRGVIQLPSQLGMSLNTASQFRAQLIQKEMEIELYKNIMKDSSEVRRLEAERDQIQTQLNKLVDGPARTAKGGKNKKLEVFTPLSEGPGLEMEFAAAEREYFVQSKLVELLRHQLELALIESKKQEPTFLVIDPPVVASLPYSPDVRIVTVLGALLGAFLCVVWILMVNQVAYLQQRFKGVVKTTRPQLSIAQK